MALTPSFSTGGMPRPHEGSIGTSVSSLLKTKMPSLKSAGASKGVKLQGVKMPKASAPKGVKMPKMTNVKSAKSTAPKASALSSALKAIVSGSKKLGGAAPAGPGMGMPSAIGAPAAAPAPSFFGNVGPSQGAPGLGM